MKLLNKLTNTFKAFGNAIFFVMISYTNNLVVIGSESNSSLLESKFEDNQFEKTFRSNTIPFSEYDNYQNQLRTFFGFYSVESEKSYFPDKSIIQNSDFIREIYTTKLNDMTINKNKYNIEK